MTCYSARRDRDRVRAPALGKWECPGYLIT